MFSVPKLYHAPDFNQWATQPEGLLAKLYAHRKVNKFVPLTNSENLGGTNLGLY